ncbi:ABC transporter ATP-binding protein [Bacillus songklensis]|uniref:ABC transporter ATP-binding protein n=1 Tax=Bacillus songklensis TaxID=1069116 RepID=A0ABV8B7G6_9BACI
MTFIKVDSVSKKFGKKMALSSTSFQLQKGECVVLCGGNGAGKSTLLHILAAISKPTTGTVWLNNVHLQKNRQEYVSQIGYMPDDFFAQQMMTVQEFLSFYAAHRQVAEKQIDEILQRIGLLEKKRELVKNLSKGMRQRLVFGQALLGSPLLLLLDEPTNGLDPFWVNEFVAILQEVKKSGTTIVFSTHMMDVAAEVGDTILFMKEGKIVKTIRNELDKEKTTIELLHLHRSV